MKYWIFGAGKFGKKCYELYHDQLDFCGFIDNDETKNHLSFCGICVVSYRKFKVVFNRNEERIIIASDYCAEMYAQLMSDGYDEYVEKVYRDEGGLTTFESCWNMVTNSSNGEDIWLKTYFSECYPADYKGIYVDVGAFHPFYSSNSRWAYDAGWRGINIDANADCIKLFEKFRPEDKNINCGVSDEAGELEFYIYNGLDMCTFDKNLFKDRLRLRETRKVSVRTLNEILEENNVTDIDFLDIDVEGLDEKIIMSFDWKKYNPQCVLVEILNKNSIEDILETKIHRKMVAEGYRLVNYAIVTAMYVKEDRNIFY